MTTVKTWEQHDFRRPNRHLYQDSGDYYSLEHFIPSRDLRRLERFPTWSPQIAYNADWIRTYAVHYDAENARFVFVGHMHPSDASAQVATYYVDHATFTASTPAVLTDAPTEVGGIHRQNVLFSFDKWMFVDPSGHVYWNTTYSGTVSQEGNNPSLSGVYAAGLLIAGEKPYMLTEDGDVWKWNNGTERFNEFCAAYMALPARFVLHFRDTFLIFATHPDGTMIINQVADADPPLVEQLAVLPAESGRYKPQSTDLDWSVPYVVHEDQIYFSPGAYLTYGSSPSFDRVPIYVFNGSYVELVDVVDPDFAEIPDEWGLLSWKGRLLLFFWQQTEQQIYLLTGGRFVRILHTEMDCLEYGGLYSVAGELLTMEHVDGGTGALRFLRASTTNVFTSSWLDMGRPTAEKYLSRLSALISGPTADFDVKLEYRTELDGSTSEWTTAIETDNRRYVHADSIGARFNLLQIRVTFTDNTTTNPAVCLESLGATYSHG